VKPVREGGESTQEARNGLWGRGVLSRLRPGRSLSEIRIGERTPTLTAPHSHMRIYIKIGGG